MLSAPAIKATRYSVPTTSLDRGRRFHVVGNSNVKSGIRELQVSWVKEVARRRGESISAMAVNAGMADVTLSRFVKHDWPGALSPLTIEKIKRYSGLPGPGDLQPEPVPDDGFREASQFDYKAELRDQPAFAAIIEAALNGRNNAAPWLLRTDAFTSIGYLPGDVLITDNAAHPRAGDLVVAQIVDQKAGMAETVFRIIQPPYLIGVGNDPETRTPIPIDNNRVMVMGVVTESLRARRSIA